MCCGRLKITLLWQARICLFRLQGDDSETQRVLLKQNQTRLRITFSASGQWMGGFYPQNLLTSLHFTHCTQIPCGAGAGENGQAGVNFWSPIKDQIFCHMEISFPPLERRICAESEKMKGLLGKKCISLIHSQHLVIIAASLSITFWTSFSGNEVTNIILETTPQMTSVSKEKPVWNVWENVWENKWETS